MMWASPLPRWERARVRVEREIGARGRQRRRPSAPAPRSIAASRASAPFRKDIDNRILKSRSAEGRHRTAAGAGFKPAPAHTVRDGARQKSRIGWDATQIDNPATAGLWLQGSDAEQVAGSDRQARRTPSRRRGDPCGRPRAKGFDRSRSERNPVLPGRRLTASSSGRGYSIEDRQKSTDSRRSTYRQPSG